MANPVYVASVGPGVVRHGAVHQRSRVCRRAEERGLQFDFVMSWDARRASCRTRGPKPVPPRHPRGLVDTFEATDANPLDTDAVNESANALLAALDALG
jgi:hypothetical protein